MEEAIRIGTENQVRPDDDHCAKTALGQSRRERILRFFGRRHKKQGSTYVSKPLGRLLVLNSFGRHKGTMHNDFLAPGLELKDRDRKILDRLDFSTLSEFQ
jgi:hypothetical protein